MMGLEQFLFFSLNPQAFLFLLFVLEPDLIKGTLGLSVAGTLNGKLGGNPLGFAFAVYFQVQYGVVVAVFRLQTTCYHDNPPL